MNSPKGVSPLIASVLLIAFTMAIAAMLTAWISSFTTAQKEKTAVFEEKIACNYGFIENDLDFTEYNGTDTVNNGIFKTRVKNTGTIDISIGKYHVWYKDVTVPTIWTISDYTNTSIKKQDSRILTLNVSGPDKLTKIKLIGHLCDGVTTTISEPLSSWNRLSTFNVADVIPAAKS